jgi:plastocyanin
VRVPLAWLVRGALVLVFVGVALFAVLTPQPTSQPVVTPVATLPPPTLAPPVPSATPRPTQTPQAITSVILRETPAPYPTSTPFPSNIATVSIVDFAFMPGTVRIKAGQTVFWHNDGTEQHDVSGSDWHSGALDPTYTYNLTFGTAGVYAYRCSIHLDMTGSVIVS